MRLRPKEKPKQIVPLASLTLVDRHEFLSQQVNHDFREQWFVYSSTVQSISVEQSKSNWANIHSYFIFPSLCTPPAGLIDCCYYVR